MTDPRFRTHLSSALYVERGREGRREKREKRPATLPWRSRNQGKKTKRKKEPRPIIAKPLTLLQCSLQRWNERSKEVN